MKSILQTTLLGDAMQSAKTNKKSFLEKMDSLIPWEDWVSIIQPIYYKGRVGQKPYAIDLMLRIYILQNFYDLSDMGVMYEIIDSRAFSDFCGVSTPDQVPNGDTIGNFRNLLIRNNIQEQIFAQVVSILNKNNLILKKVLLLILHLSLHHPPLKMLTDSATPKRILSRKEISGISDIKLTSV